MGEWERGSGDVCHRAVSESSQYKDHLMQINGIPRARSSSARGLNSRRKAAVGVLLVGFARNGIRNYAVWIAILNGRDSKRGGATTRR